MSSLFGEVIGLVTNSLYLTPICSIDIASGSDSDTGTVVDGSFGRIYFIGETERERDRETERDTERETEKGRGKFILFYQIIPAPPAPPGPEPPLPPAHHHPRRHFSGRGSSLFGWGKVVLRLFYNSIAGRWHGRILISVIHTITQYE